MKQWIDVQVINSECETTHVLGGVAFHAEKVTIWFSAVNRTTYPLAIQEIFVEISRRRPDGPKWETYSRKEEIALSPNAHRGTEASPKSVFEHHFFMNLNLDGPMVEEYKANKFVVSISGHISFESVIGRVERQGFAYLIISDPNNIPVAPLGSELEKGKETDT